MNDLTEKQAARIEQAQNIARRAVTLMSEYCPDDYEVVTREPSVEISNGRAMVVVQATEQGKGFSPRFEVCTIAINVGLRGGVRSVHVVGGHKGTKTRARKLLGV